MKKTIILFCITAFFSCNSNNNAEKESGLRKKELALEEKERSLKEKELAIDSTQKTDPGNKNINPQKDELPNTNLQIPITSANFVVLNEKLYLKINGKQFLIPKGKVEVWPITITKEPNSIASCNMSMGGPWSADYIAKLKPNGDIVVEEDYYSQYDGDSKTTILKIEKSKY